MFLEPFFCSASESHIEACLWISQPEKMSEISSWTLVSVDYIPLLASRLPPRTDARLPGCQQLAPRQPAPRPCHLPPR